MAANPQQSGALADVGGRATPATGAIYVLLLVLLFAALGVILERQNHAAQRAESYSRASTQVQKLLRGVNEVTVTDGPSSSRALATDALKDLAALRSRLDASALDEANSIDFSLLQKRVTEFVATKDVSTSNIEAMISLGKISTEAGKLSDTLANDKAAAADSARHSAQLMRLLLLAAAREIKDLIGASSAQVESGTGLIRQAGSAMTNIVGANEEVVKVIGNITAATSEQAGGIEQINSAIAQLETTTQQNAALVEQAAAAAESMRERAQMLQTLVERFKLAASNSTRTEHIHLEPAIAAARIPGRHTAALPR